MFTWDCMFDIQLQLNHGAITMYTFLLSFSLSLSLVHTCMYTYTYTHYTPRVHVKREDNINEREKIIEVAWLFTNRT